MRFKMKASQLFVACLVLISCGSPGRHDMQRYFEQEVQSRMSMLHRLPAVKDSLESRISAIDSRINDFILLSKDVENLGASVQLSNEYFQELAAEFTMNSADFGPVATNMHVNEISVILKKNELNFLNQLVLRYDTTGALFTAQ
jgi:hypothetical protein